jgi:hypothetical protein
MKENSVNLSLFLNAPITLPPGSYVMYEGEKFQLVDEYKPIEENLQKYKYELKFEANEMRLRKFILFYSRQDLLESNWTLTSDAASFMNIVILMIRRAFGDAHWQDTTGAYTHTWNVGTVEPTAIMTISFSDVNIFDGLTQIAEQYEAEWLVEGTNIHLFNKLQVGTAVDLQREVHLKSIQRSQGDKKRITRLYAFGSTRNLNPNYRNTNTVVEGIVQRRLQLPAGTPYIDSEAGLQPDEVIEGIKIFEEVYPKGNNSVTGVRFQQFQDIDDEGNPVNWTIYYITDSSITFNPNDYLLPNEALRIVFQSGGLNGREFDVNWHQDAQEFEIINEELADYLTLPNDTLNPDVGDAFVLYNFDIKAVADHYVTDAEQELLTEAKAWLDNNSKDTDVYTCETNPIKCRELDYDFDIGQSVTLKSVILDGGQRESRIMGYKKNLYDQYICTYTAGDNSKYSRLATVEKTVSELQYAGKTTCVYSRTNAVKAPSPPQTASIPLVFSAFCNPFCFNFLQNAVNLLQNHVYLYQNNIDLLEFVLNCFCPISKKSPSPSIIHLIDTPYFLFKSKMFKIRGSLNPFLI